MNSKNFLILAIALLFTLTLFSQSVFALTYRGDVDNGSWSQYTGSLSSQYYATDISQATYNRGFETTFTELAPSTCSEGWCRNGTNGGTHHAETTIVDYAQGNQSMYIYQGNASPSSTSSIIFQEDEYSGDTNVVFAYKWGTFNGQAVNFGYVDDINNFYTVYTLPTNTGWHYASYVIPRGNFRIGFQAISGSSNTADFYVDDFQVTRNNTGTFSTTVPSNCSSLLNCSNIEKSFPSSQLGSLYWVVDYISGATCTASVNGSSVSMTEGLGGMYYVPVSVAVSSGASIDVNLSATCSRIPAVTKSYFATPTLYRYNHISGGDFEYTTTIPSKTTACDTYFCQVVSSTSNLSDPSGFSISNEQSTNGNNTAVFSYNRSSSSGMQYITFFPISEKQGGATIYFDYKELYNYSTAYPLLYGYVNDNNTFTKVGEMSFTSTDWNRVSYNIPAGNYRFAIQEASNGAEGNEWLLDNVLSSLAKRTSSITTGNNATSNNALRGDTVSFYTNYLDDVNDVITGATCSITTGVQTLPMTYNSNTARYEVSYLYVSNGTYSTSSTCSSTNYSSQTSASYNLTVGDSLTLSLEAQAISGITSITKSDTNATITLEGISQSGDLIFKARTSDASYTLTTEWINSNKSNKQYFVYTSTDGNTWTFSDTLTFGATTSTPVQKIWNGTGYTYSVTTTLSQNTWAYYKFTYQAPAYYSETINSNSAWFNQNPPTNYEDSSGKEYDIFSDSNYSNVQSYTIDPFQNLVSGDLTVGYELQFTAYGTSAGTLAVGSRVGTTDTTSNISVTTTEKRFSVPIAPSSRDAVLLIKSTSATSNTYYITDYAIVPRSYFFNQLEVVNPDNTQLQAILRNGVSQKYVMEGQGVKIKTSAYDISGDLTKIEIQTYLGGTLVKDQFIPLTSSAGNYITFNQAIEGVIDLNGIGGELVTSSALRSITYKAILWNSSNQSVSEQYATVSVLQFPYFPNDFKLLADILNVKLGTNPRMRVSIQDSVPSNFLGLTFAFFDSSHTIAIPNYSETIYAKDLGCTTLTNCTKEFTFDKYVWEGTGSYTVQVTALINTENKNYTDSYTNVTKHIEVSEAGYLQVQMIQYMERHQNAPYHTPYNSTEKIPLMLGITDDTGKDLTNTISPYFTLVVNDVNLTAKYFPEASSYDETSGTTIWAWNQYFYDDSGNLLTQDSNVQIKGVLVDKRQTQSTVNDFGFSNRCVRYPFDIVGDFGGDFADTWNGFIGSDILNFKIKKDSNGWLSYGINLWGSVGSTLLANGCMEYPPMIIRAEDSNKLMITIDDTFDLSLHNDNRQALYCGQKYDNNSIVDQMGDDFGCVLFVHEDLQQIDYIHMQIGNENSDYSVTNSNKQYLDFTITGNDLMFSNTADLLRGWSQKGYFGASPTNSPSVQEVLLNAWHDIFTPTMTNEEIMSQYQFQELIGGNKNFNVLSDFNSNVYNKVIFFKVKGLSTINAYDYLSASEQATFNTKNFLSYSKTKGFPIYSKDLQILLYSNSTESPFKVIETSSPIVINKAPSTKQLVKNSDGNMVITTASEILPFHVISTMSYANSTINDRLIANLQFKQIIKANPVNTTNENAVSGISKIVDNILFGKDARGNPTGLFNSPLGFISNPLNITIIFLIIGVILVITLMLRNMSGFFQPRR